MISRDTVYLWMPLSAFVFLMVTGLLADTHYVDKFNGAGASSPYTSWATAATGIQDAMDASDAGDYSLTPGSPCVNTGTNLDWMTNGVDFCGARRIDWWYGKVDMGAYEFTACGVMFLGY